MTNHWIDIKNTGLSLVCGSNGAENHPVIMQWVNEHIANGKKLMVADPRKTRMAGIAEATGGKWIRMRPGTNAAFMMGLVNYAIQNGRADLTYLGEKVTTRLFNADSGGNGNAQLDATSTYGGWPKGTDASLQLNTGRTDYVRATVSASGVGGTNTETVSGMPVVLSDWQTNPDSVYSYLTQQASGYTSTVVANICDIPGGSTAFEAFADIVTNTANRPVNIQYSMGGTQHSHASQDLRAYCILQLVLGSMGKAGGGVNALRGLSNVQGSTDQGTLNGFLPGYSSVALVGQTYATYQNGQFGNRIATGAPYWTGIQQVGSRNMLHWYFRQAATPVLAEYSATDNSNFDLLPKGAGYNHRQMFEKMQPTVSTGKVKCLIAWGQNPAVTEPNLGLIKSGLQELDTLVVIDMFESETAGWNRKPTGVTYLLPAAGFVEEEGSVTNSGRWIQWRNKAINPQGGSKSDTEILMGLADKLITAGAFSHIPGGTYANLYGYYGWTPPANFNAVAATVAQNFYKEMCSDQYLTGPDWGALWIYRGGWVNASSTNKAKSRVTESGVPPFDKGINTGWGWAWLLNRRVFYNNGGTVANGDVSDTFVPPDKVARIFCHSGSFTPAVANYSNTYRAYSKITGGAIPQHREPFETPRLDLLTQYGNIGIAPTGPWATVQTTLEASGAVNGPTITVTSAAGLADGDILTINPGGSNQENIMIALSGGISGNIITLCTIDNPTGLTKAHASGELVRKDLTGTYPLVLTTFRVTEHFQGGPMTRNVPWLCELVPEAIIEINSADAYTLGINTGDPVYVDTIRASGIGPFKAVVGTSLESNQRVRKGYVAVPWHWGNKGLKTGPSANDVTIDSLDPDSAIQETKACICRIHK